MYNLRWPRDIHHSKAHKKLIFIVIVALGSRLNQNQEKMMEKKEKWFQHTCLTGQLLRWPIKTDIFSWRRFLKVPVGLINTGKTENKSELYTLWQPPFYQFISAVLHYCTTVLHYSLNLLHKWPLSSEPFQKWSKQSSSCAEFVRNKEKRKSNTMWTDRWLHLSVCPRYCSMALWRPPLVDLITLGAPPFLGL